MIIDRAVERGSVSCWIPQLRAGDEIAAQTIWDRYKQQMHAVAGRELGKGPRTVADEEDVIIDAFAAFLRRFSCGAYESMSNRDDLWRLLATITKTFAWKQSRFLGRTCRRTVSCASRTTDLVLKQLASGNSPPDMLVSMADTLDQLLNKLDNAGLRQTAIDRLHGLTNEEIATKQGRSLRTIERRLQIIRSLWNNQLQRSTG